jgi:hypothetical protein
MRPLETAFIASKFVAAIPPEAIEAARIINQPNCRIHLKIMAIPDLGSAVDLSLACLQSETAILPQLVERTSMPKALLFITSIFIKSHLTPRTDMQGASIFSFYFSLRVTPPSFFGQLSNLTFPFLGQAHLFRHIPRFWESCTDMIQNFSYGLLFRGS